MKILIAYHSKTGTSEKCAIQLAKGLNAVDLVDLKVKTPNFEAYDLVVIGGSIRMGRFMHSVRNVLKKYESIFLQKKMIYFLNGAYPENREKYYKDNISKALRDGMLGAYFFGGEMVLSKLKGPDYLVAMTVLRQQHGGGEALPAIDDRAIEQCANRIRAMGENPS